MNIIHNQFLMNTIINNINKILKLNLNIYLYLNYKYE